MSNREERRRGSRGESPRSLADFFVEVPKRRLRLGEVPDVGVVVYSDGVDDFVLLDSSDNEAVRRMMSSHCDECARAAGGMTA